MQLDVGKVTIDRRPVSRVRSLVGGSACSSALPVSVVLMQQRGGLYVRRASATVRCGSEITVTNLAADEYLLNAFLKNGDFIEPIVVPVSAMGNDLDTPLEPMTPLQLSGRIHLGENIDSSLYSKLAFWLKPLRGLLLAQQRPVKPDAEGRFAFAFNRERAYEIELRGISPPYYIKEILYNGSRLAGRILEPNLKALSHSLDIVLSDKAGGIEGVVLADDKPLAGTTVIIASWPLQLKKGYPYHETATTDNRGRFRKGGLGPGSYRIVAATSAAVDRFQKPNELAWALGTAERVEIAEGSVASVVLDKVIFQ